MRQAKYWIFLLPLFFVLVCIGAYAQANSEITGIVTDQTGAVIAGADVTILDPATGFTRTTVSGGTGLYNIGGLNPANYNLTVTAKGFEKYVQTGVVINVSATVRVDAKLTLGAETQTVSVVADALAVQTDTNVVSTLISSEEITEIATENRNFAALAALGLGVSSGLPDSNTPGAFSANYYISINGLRNTHNIWLIDGGESSDRGGGGGMQIMPSQDAIAEFQVMSSNYPPDYGISSGATISLSLKSGTKTFHGAGWEENRATAYDANTYFGKLGQKAPDDTHKCGTSGYFGCRPAMHYNIYGFNIGGPVYVPKVFNTNKNKLFFFWNEEWRKTSSVGSSNNPTIDPLDVPVAANIKTTGGVTGLTYVTPAFSPTTFLVVPNVSPNSAYAAQAGTGGRTSLFDLGLVPNQCFQGVQKPNADNTVGGTKCYVDNTYAAVQAQTIPQSLFDKNGQIYLASTNAVGGGPLPVATNSNDYAVATVALPFKDRNDIARIDYNINDKWSILGHYIAEMQNQTSGQPELGWGWASYNTLTSILSSPAHSAAIKLSGTINPNLLLEASINYDGNGADITPSANTYPANVPGASAYFTNFVPVVAAYTITRKIWPGITGFGGPYGTGENTMTEPYHNAAQDYDPKLDVSYTHGKNQFKFGIGDNHYTKNQMLYGTSQGDFGFSGMSNDGLMDMLMGIPTSYSQNMIAPIRHYVMNSYSAYGNDNWHVTPRLTLQLGVRYDMLPHSYERQFLTANFVQADYDRTKLPVYTAGSNLSSTSPDLTTYTAEGSTQGIPSYTNGMESPAYNSKFVSGHVMGSAPQGIVQNDYKTWMPRVGFSDDLYGNGKTVLRGGFGTFFEHMQGNDVFDTATSSPFDPQLNVSNPNFSSPGYNWSTGATTGADSLTFVGGQTSISKIYRAPAVAQYSLGVQHELAPSIIWVIQYVGNVAWHQNVKNHINNMDTSIRQVAIDNAGLIKVDARCKSGDGGNKYVNPLTGSNNLDTDCIQNVTLDGGMNRYNEFPGYGDINQDQNQTNGSYNSFQTGLRIQNRWGLSGEVDYTWSHEIDITTSERAQVSNPWNFKYDKASGGLDRRHILNVNYMYKLPIATKSTGIVKTLAGGWEISGTAVYESGQPQTPGNSAPYDAVGLGGNYTIRPNQLNKVHYHKSRTQWFDTTDFVAPTPSWLGGPNLGFGNSGRDAIVGPSRVNFTTSLYKSFAIYGTARFELRFQSFNTLNHTEYNSVNYSMSCANAPDGLAYAGQQTGTPGTGACNASGTYGQLTGTYDPRQLQIGGKFIF